MPIAQRLLEIALLRRGPQDLPYSQTLLLVTVAASLAGTLAANAVRPLAESPALFIAVFFLYTVGFFHGVLQMRELVNRRTQTLTAVFGTDAIITLVALPVLASGGEGPPGPMLVLASVAFTVWQLAVVTHILRNALSCGLGQAVLWTLGYWLGTEFLYVTLQGGL